MEYVWDLNTDTNTRDQILFGENFNEAKYIGGVRSFENLPAAIMKKLLELNFATEEDAQNDMPCIKKLMEYADTHENITFNGYAVSPKRDDYRISIETIKQDFTTPKDRDDFTEMFRLADDFDADEDQGYAWYD